MTVSPPIVRLVAMAAAMVLSVGCAERSPPASVVSAPLLVMGTEATVVLPAREAARLPAAAELLSTVLTDAERRLSRFRTDSELSLINREAGVRPVPVSSLTFATLEQALKVAHWSGGAFDPTVTPLVHLWGFGARPPERLPDAAQIAAVRDTVGYAGIVLDSAAATVFLQRTNMSLDLGGIAKGTATEAVAVALSDAGYSDFLINLGGDIRCTGAPDGQPAWRVGVRHPFDRNRLLGVVSMRHHRAVVTSGNYERYVVIEGERYTHVIDPRSGFPVRGMAGVTVLTEDAGLADGLATALFVAGLDGATAILNRVPATDALLVPDRQPLEIWVTPGFAAVFEPQPECRAAIRVMALAR